jgi:Arc/MetJ family transcription regulator
MIDLDDDLLAEAQEYSGLTDITALIHEALSALIQREERRRLAISDR